MKYPLKSLAFVTLICSSLPALSQLSYFEDFSDGVANDWASDQGIWQVENFYYHGVGQLVNDRWLNAAYVETFGGENVSIEGDMHSDAGFDDVSKILVARYQDEGNFLFLNFVASERRYFIVEQVVNGIRTLILPENQHFIPPHGQTEWHHCRTDIDGTRVVAYFDGLEVFNRHIPQILIRPGVVGVMTFSSPTGGDEELFLDNYRAGFFDYIPIAGMSVNPGSVHSGNINSIAEPDGSRLVLRPGPVIGTGRPPLKAAFFGSTGLRTPTEFRLKFLGSVSSGNIRQTVSLMNYQTNQFEVVDQRPGTIANTRLEIVVTTNPSRFINSVTGEVRVEASYVTTGPVISFPWSARIDYVAFTSRT